MPLLNAFIDSVVCVGFSSERGAALDLESKTNGSLFTSSLQSSVLAIVTADRAIYPQSRSSESIDPFYPPIGRISSYSITQPSNNSGRTTPISPFGINIRTSKQHIIPIVYNNLPLFCFPDGAQATYEQANERIHQIVFTQEDGKRSYAVVLTCQQSFILKTNKPDDDGIYQINDVQRPLVTTRRPSISKIPIAIEKLKPTLSSTPVTIAPVASPAPSTPATPSKTRSKKMPSSFHFPETLSGSRSRSTSSSDLSKQPHYVTPTLSSYMKNLSPSATPPPTRMVRTNSQNNLAAMSGNTPSTPTTSRGRSNSNASQPLPLTTAPSLPTPVSTSISTSVPTSTSIPTSISTSKPIDTTKPFYLPHCIVLISSQPYWTEMQETITLIHDEIMQSKIELNSSAYRLLIQKYAFLACNTPVPPIPWERFSLSFSLTHNQSVLLFDPPININRTVLDLDLSILLLTLSIGKLLDVLAAIFTQQPIIFFSTNYSKLVTTLECLLYLIYPLKWINIYVPLVPNGLRDHYLEGPPGAYIMGTHSRHQSIVEQLDISLTCNLDNDKNIHVPKDIKFHQIPSTKLQHFIGPITQFLEDIKVSRSLQNVHTPIRLRMDQQREFERKQRIETNQKITKIFLDLMVDLCGDALQPIYWKVNHQSSPTNTLTKSSKRERKNSIHPQAITSFSKEQYLNSKAESIELDFYRQFVASTAFQLFLEEELTSITPTIFRQICHVHLLSNEDQLYHIDHTLEDIGNTENGSTTTLCESMSSQMLLPLPNWPLNKSTHYLDSCIETFSNELQQAQQERSPAVIAIYAYLRGCALLARGNLIDGLRDLYLIDNPNLFPRDFIEKNIVPRLSDECLLDLFLHEKFYTESPEWKKVQTRPTQRMSKIDLDESGNSFDEQISDKSSSDFDLSNEMIVVENALTYEQFCEHVSRLSIAVDKETAEKLFNALLYWTDNSIIKTLKKDKTLTNNNTNKPSETLKPLGRRVSSASISLKDTLTMLNDHKRDGQSPNASPRPSTQHNSTLPAQLFESFLENWQQTNAEKIRMNSCLPDDRQKQESILKISTSGVVSKKDGPGQIVLTQKRLYFIPETRSSARLLTELINIISIDKYQHQTVFSSSKPGIKIYTKSAGASTSLPRDTNATLKAKSSSLEKDSKISISLFFKNNHEQELWYILIMELWSGLTIAHEQCDTTVLNKASRHIALMDTLANMDYEEETMTPIDKQLLSSRVKSKQRHNEASRELALNDLSTFTRMRQTGTFKPLSDETRNVLTRRLSPSINESERHAVRCLVSIEHPENGRSSLWCSYGSKLKVFNVATWICDPTDILFSSEITCMCLDARHKLWVGCIQGELFVVDTITRTCGAQLATIEGEGGCQSIAFDTVHNHILTANRTSKVILWNASNWERLSDINLYDIYTTTHNIQQRTFKSEGVVTFRNQAGQPTNEQNNMSNNSSGSGSAQVTPSPTDKLERIQIYEDLLFVCYRDDYILVLRKSDSNTYMYEHLISVKYKTGDSTPIESFLVYNKQLWISTGCIIHIFNINNTKNKDLYDLLMKKPVDDDHLITMLGFSGYIWAGSLRGNVYVFRMDNYELYKTFAGHRDSVYSICPMLDMYVVSGSGQNDTSIAIWENIQTSNGTASSTTNAPAKRSMFNTSKIPKTNDTKGDTSKSIDML
ncbi:unnamed protein product [Adineta steineri]|uniref:UDENN domain-containing protein n=1 Tax=Adineta steineri TaxID=433720 RepID=A0A814GI21_9BILA|nr:unnamed protein product [Adineta steineri]